MALRKALLAAVALSTEGPGTHAIALQGEVRAARERLREIRAGPGERGA